MYRFLFAGRHEREKWFDIVVDSIELLRRNFPETFSQVQFVILANGSMTESFIRKYSMEPWFVDARNQAISELDFDSLPQCLYLGHQNKDNVLEIMGQVDFVLMPSRCLETFGLVALEAASRGTPTIAFAKWWLESLILSDARLSELTPANVVATIARLLRRLDDEWYERLSSEAYELTHRFRESQWISTLKACLPQETKRILMLMDYTTFIGGAETHVETIRRTLKREGYEVEILWWPLEGSWWILTLKRLLGIIISSLNIKAYRDIATKIDEFDPQVVWCHSVSRYFGAYALSAIPKNCTRVITYHDLGYFSPRPSEIESVNELLHKMSLVDWIEWLHGIKKYIPIFEIFRYLQIKSLLAVIQDFDFHFVPGEFMQEIAQRIIKCPSEKIVYLPHYYEERISPSENPEQTLSVW